MRSSSTAEALSPIYPKWDGPPSRKPTATLDTFCHLHGSYQRTRHPSAVSLPRSLIFYISFSVISELHVDLHRRDLLSPNKLNKAPRNLPSFLLINVLLQKNFWYYIEYHKGFVSAEEISPRYGTGGHAVPRSAYRQMSVCELRGTLSEKLS